MLTGDYANIMPYDGKIRSEYFVLMQWFAVIQYFSNNIFFFNLIPLVGLFWSTDWSFSAVFNGPLGE